MLVWNHDARRQAVGVDVSPFFAREARAEIDLLLGDIRQLPFADGAFTKAFSLDVLEHLSRDGLHTMLREAARVLAPGGALFVYTHVRQNSPLALGLRGIHRVAAGLERLGLIDQSLERLRCSDHLNPLADIPDLHQVAAAAGFRVTKLRYYTPLIGGFLENIAVPVVEHAMNRRVRRRRSSMPDAASAEPIVTARAEAKARIARRGPLYYTLAALTELAMLDVVCFGRVRSGPFFALLVKDP